MEIRHDETLPNGIRVYQEYEVFGERWWYVERPGCCGRVRAHTRELAIEYAKEGCAWCDALPIK